MFIKYYNLKDIGINLFYNLTKSNFNKFQYISYIAFIIPTQTSLLGGVYWNQPVGPSVCPSVPWFPFSNLSNFSLILTKLSEVVSYDNTQAKFDNQPYRIRHFGVMALYFSKNVVFHGFRSLT